MSRRKGTSVSELADLVNLGPVSAGWLESAGITTVAQLRALGAVAAFKRVAIKRPGMVTYNMLYALEGALRGVRWDHMPATVREDLKRAAEDPAG